MHQHWNGIWMAVLPRNCGLSSTPSALERFFGAIKHEPCIHLGDLGHEKHVNTIEHMKK